MTQCLSIYHEYFQLLSPEKKDFPDSPSFTFEKFSRTLCNSDLTIGIPEDIFAKQDSNGNITLLNGIYDFKLLFNLQYIIDGGTAPTAVEINQMLEYSLLLNFIQKVDNKILTNNNLEYNLNFFNSKFYRSIESRFNIAGDTGLYGISITPLLKLRTGYQPRKNIEFRNMILYITRVGSSKVEK